MDEATKKIFSNPNEVLSLIDYVNANMDELFKDQYHTSKSYFYSGQCNLYAKILSDIFGDFAIPYRCGGHYITKIGNVYYDVNGIYTDLDNKESFYEEYKDFLLDSKMNGVGNYHPGFDDELMQVGVDAGIDYIKKKCISEESSKSM